MLTATYCKGDVYGINQGRGCWWVAPAPNGHKQCRFCRTPKEEETAPKPRAVVMSLPPVVRPAGGF